MSRSIEMIETVAARIEAISWRFVFLGGATTELYVTDSAVTDIRPTMDVDVIVEVGTFARYASLEESLRSLGFQPAIAADTPICRWQIANEDYILSHDIEVQKRSSGMRYSRREAGKPALAVRNGELSPVHVPSREDEALRDYREHTRQRIAGRLEEIAGQERYEARVKTPRAFKGIGTLTALIGCS